MNVATDLGLSFGVIDLNKVFTKFLLMVSLIFRKKEEKSVNTFAVPSLAATRWVVVLSTKLFTLAPRLLATRKGLLLSTGT